MHGWRHPELVEMYRCPLTGSPLVVVSEQELAYINQQIRSGSVVNHGRHQLTRPLCGALINRDRSAVIPVQQGVVRLVVEELILTDCLDLEGAD